METIINGWLSIWLYVMAAIERICHGLSIKTVKLEYAKYSLYIGGCCVGTSCDRGMGTAGRTSLFL